MKKFTIMAVFAVLIAGLLLMGCKEPDDNNNDNNNNNNNIEVPVNAQGNLLILQAYGNAGDGSPAGVSHSFVELYNISDKAIDLSGISLYYASGIRGDDVTQDEPWSSIALTGTIPAKGSFLILGKKHDVLSATRYKITDGYGDINNDNLSLNRRGFKAALIKGSAALTVQNPFTAGSDGKPISGYIDMVGALNAPDANPRDNIFGYETAPARNSASEAVRRADLTDTDNNSIDFIAARYASIGDGAFTNEELEVRKPRNSSAGTWDPFKAPAAPTPPPSPTGNKLLIFQAYGGDNANGVSHHFVELYNNGDTTVDLSNYSLQYAAASNGDTPESDWTVIPLTGSIPAKTSYLILGQKNPVQAQRIRIADDSGDVNKSDFILSNRGFKVALISNTTKLTVPNPYNTDGSWTKAAGYIDMVGCSNTFGTNIITGYEGPSSLTDLPRNSAQEGIRRNNLTDTDNNVNDFVSVRYTTVRTVQYPHGVDDYEIPFYTPKNVTAGTWDPMVAPTEPDPPPSSTGNTLLIFQAYGGDNANGVTHHFVELYNNSDSAVSLIGYSLQYAAASDGSTPESDWTVIPLTGSIPAKASYLILGQKNPVQTQRIQIADNSGDVNKSDFILSNRGFKVALINGTTKLAAANPYNTDGNWTKAAGYIDMVGCSNTFGTNIITGYEGPAPLTELLRNSAQEGIRRNNLTDTDNNIIDFVSVRYTTARTAQYPHGVDIYEIPFYTPKNAAAGTWDPMDPPPEPPPSGETERLMILQANPCGNSNGGGGGFPNGLVELYNNTNSAIDLGAGNYYLHIGTNTAWTTVIPLTGVIPAKSSFLIVSSADVSPAPDFRADLPTANQTASFAMANNFKVALMKNQSSLLSANNPFTDVSLSADYVDMLGTGTANGFEAAAASGSKPQPPRRISLTDTDNNSVDFAQWDARGQGAGNGIANDQLYKYWPRNAAAGAWNPLTGIPEVHPAVTP